MMKLIVSMIVAILAQDSRHFSSQASPLSSWRFRWKPAAGPCAVATSAVPYDFEFVQEPLELLHFCWPCSSRPAFKKSCSGNLVLEAAGCVLATYCFILDCLGRPCLRDRICFLDLFKDFIQGCLCAHMHVFLVLRLKV